MTSHHSPSIKFEQLRNQAEALIQKRPETAPSSSLNILELIHELKIYQAELEIQNEELKRAQGEIFELHQEYEDLYEFAPCGYITMNNQGIIQRINLTGADLIGKGRQILPHSCFSQFIASSWQNLYRAALQKAGETGNKQSVELVLNREKNQPAWVRLDIQADRDKTGTVIQWRMVMVDVALKKEAEIALQDSERRYRQLFNDMISGATVLEISERDHSGRIVDARFLDVNASFARLTGIPTHRAVGKSIRQIWPQTEAFWFENLDQALVAEQPITVAGLHQEMGKHFQMSAFRLDDQRLATTFIDISDQKKIEQTLEAARHKLEAQVSAQTADLRKVNERLRKEVEARKQVQIELVHKAEELKERSDGLESANAALKVLLKEVKNERRRLEEKVVCNLNDLIRPHLATIASGELTLRQRLLLDTVQRGIDDIASPLSRRFIIDGRHLTPLETQVASLIRQGRTTKEIAAQMGVSKSTIDFHRLNIRRRLNLTHKKTNLQSYLRSLS
ncbi:PAS domain-containing protein [Desulfosarcina sp.]|uniref:PAS domain-containing protein n=1 Tax=Desulfosarcina sp. TaxID=2027861 RepID=UPI003565E2AD